MQRRSLCGDHEQHAVLVRDRRAMCISPLRGAGWRLGCPTPARCERPPPLCVGAPSVAFRMRGRRAGGSIRTPAGLAKKLFMDNLRRWQARQPRSAKSTPSTELVIGTVCSADAALVMNATRSSAKCASSRARRTRAPFGASG